ncbi:MAG TPA: hypothetical protein P5279_01635 [Anaerohalosphaeraceae bacterium]|jgi:hypothetical protein|nr:hypothetical protein [Anaerohalosphaeraceae bacterium]HRT49170.1 hypothetical protein [Anaerohalosphaeraceae bacterium]HRT85291.1 hypothetical protein [Anaerohalosphaeraceae bacterium]
MRRWRTKLLTALIIYFAGFATAIYYLAPAGERGKMSERNLKGFDLRGRVSEFRASEFGVTAETNVKKFVSFAEEKAVQLGEYIRAKLAEANTK